MSSCYSVLSTLANSQTLINRHCTGETIPCCLLSMTQALHAGRSQKPLRIPRRRIRGSLNCLHTLIKFGVTCKDQCSINRLLPFFTLIVSYKLKPSSYFLRRPSATVFSEVRLYRQLLFSSRLYAPPYRRWSMNAPVLSLTFASVWAKNIWLLLLSHWLF